MYATYQQFIAAHLSRWPEYYSLYRLLSTQRVTIPDTTAYIIDITAASKDVRRYQDSDAFYIALQERGTATHTRIIGLEYSSIENLDGSLLDTLALHCKLDPFFVCENLGLATAFGFNKDDDPLTHALLPSRKLSLEFGNFLWLHASILVQESIAADEGTSAGTGQTIVMLLRKGTKAANSPVPESDRPRFDVPPFRNVPVASQRGFFARYCEVLQRHDEGLLVGDSRSAIACILPLLRIMVQAMNHRLLTSSLAWRHDPVLRQATNAKAAFRLKGLDYDFRAELYRYGFECDQLAIRESIRSIRNYEQQLPEDVPASVLQEWDLIRTDLEDMLAHADHHALQFEKHVDRAIARWSLEASIEAGRSSQSVGTLSTLAFIYIPLSFVTSFFGMNLNSFGSGSVETIVFVQTSVVIVFVMLLLWITSPWISGVVAGVKESVYGLRLRFWVIRKFARISPMGAFWLFMFGLSRNAESLHQLLLTLGIWEVYGMNQHWVKPSFSESDQRSLRLGPFWVARAMAIMRVTNERGWQDRTFYQRWRNAQATQTGDISLAPVTASTVAAVQNSVTSTSVQTQTAEPAQTTGSVHSFDSE